MAEIVDDVSTIAWTWIFLVAGLGGTILIVTVLAYRRSKQRVDLARRIDVTEPQPVKSRRSKLTADLL